MGWMPVWQRIVRPGTSVKMRLCSSEGDNHTMSLSRAETEGPRGFSGDECKPPSLH